MDRGSCSSADLGRRRQVIAWLLLSEGMNRPMANSLARRALGTSSVSHLDRAFRYMRRLIGEAFLPWTVERRGKALAAMEDLEQIRRLTLAYVESMQIGNMIGRYRYSDETEPPVLYASAYAVLTRHLYNDLGSLSREDRDNWTEYLVTHQSEDGLFRDTAIANESAETEDWWGWRHLTIHVLSALKALGAVAPRHFARLEGLRPPGSLENWLSRHDWESAPDFASNSVQNVGCLFQYARDFQGDPTAARCVTRMLDWLDDHQDPHTGLWGEEFDSPRLRSIGVQAAYHILLIYFYDQRPIRHLEPLIDSLLATQNSLGGFGVRWSSSACEDIDSIDPLARLSRLSTYRRDDICSALHRALIWVLTNMNNDGGFVFRRATSFEYGHMNMRSGVDQSSLFATWFRTLSLAHIGQCLANEPVGSYGWRFVHCPGLQFWS
jgi:hypothetical protein